MYEDAVTSMMTCMCFDMHMHKGFLKFGPVSFHEKINQTLENIKKRKDKIRRKSVTKGNILDDDDDEFNRGGTNKNKKKDKNLPKD